MPELLRRAVGDRSRALGAWLLGFAAYIALIVAVFPSIHGSQQFDDLLKQYPDVLKSFLGIGDTLSITSGPGFLDTELFSLMLPLLALVLAIGVGAATIAGEEEQGLLELVVSAPVTRRAVIGWKGTGGEHADFELRFDMRWVEPPLRGARTLSRLRPRRHG